MLNIQYTKFFIIPNKKLNLNFNNTEIDEAIKKSQFSVMSEIEDRSGLGELYSVGDPLIKFVRKGSVGGWKHELSAKIEKKIVNHPYPKGIGA